MIQNSTPAIQLELRFTLRNKKSEEIIYGPSTRYYTVIPKSELEPGDSTKELKFLASQIFAKELVAEIENNEPLREAISGQPWYLTTEYLDGFYVSV